MSKESARHYSFGPFKLDSRERVLLLRDRPVPITPKAFDTLSVLVEHAGHAVTKDELLKAVWPDVVVGEATLAQNIATIRKILSEEASCRDFIETVPKYGYRFVGPVLCEIPAAVPAAADKIDRLLANQPERPIQATTAQPRTIASVQPQ